MKLYMLSTGQYDEDFSVRGLFTDKAKAVEAAGIFHPSMFPTVFEYEADRIMLDRIPAVAYPCEEYKKGEKIRI